MFELRQSEVNGNGVFATQDIPAETVIGVWCTKDIKQGVRFLYNEGMECRWYETAILGRYCNHSLTPNTSLIVTDSDLTLVSNGILEGEEIITNYNWVTEHIGYIIDTTNID
jgi:hypothetical protein